ncbi:MAG: hypothetical protein HYV07_31120 [Deltaproteobacteria bacterium]|nr:hypothetical protein [Deltaproteobacteria bacterium]
MIRRIPSSIVVVALSIFTPKTEASEPPSAVVELLRELSRDGSEGRPLPVAAHWATGAGDQTFTTPYQLELLAKGHHVLPTVLAGPKKIVERPGPLSASLATLRQWGAPFSLRVAQPEMTIFRKDWPKDDPGKWRRAPAEESPFAVGLTGTIELRLSPFGAVDPWREAGLSFTRDAPFLALQAAYPEPPLVIFLSNDEAKKLKGALHLKERRFVERFGLTLSSSTADRAAAEGWRERYGALIGGWREGMSKRWRDVTKFVGYKSFGNLAWDGAAPSYYTYDWNDSTDFTLDSPQVHAMSFVPPLERLRARKGGYWFELSVWDGNCGSAPRCAKKRQKRDLYAARGQSFTPERYAGFVQFGMWLTTPRVVREFRPSLAAREDFGAHFEALVAAVDRVWKSPVLSEFWRQGELVPNPERTNPDEPRPGTEPEDPRWFLLSTSLDPKSPWSGSTELPVFALARVRGPKRQREWLVYAHSPLGARAAVEVTIPSLGKVKIDSTPSGTFHVVRETDRRVQKLEAP